MKDLKTAVIIASEFINELGIILEDKKVKFAEIIGLAPQLVKIPKLAGSIPGAIDEIKAGLSPEYLAEIQNAVKDKLYLKNDNAEVIVEAAVNWLVMTSSTVIQITKAAKK